MGERVLSTVEAEQAIKKMQQIINGPLIDQINQLNQQGQTLSNPNVWDGRLAQEFRNTWPNIHKSLNQTQQELEELRSKVERINEDIMRAGGNR